MVSSEECIFTNHGHGARVYLCCEERGGFGLGR